INDSVTVVKGEASQQLVSYIVLEDAPEDYREQLQSRLAKTLPEYMLPAGYIALEALPLNDNGKINRAALPEPDVNLLSERERVFEAANPVEEELLAIWKRVLGRDDVGVED